MLLNLGSDRARALYIQVSRVECLMGKYMNYSSPSPSKNAPSYVLYSIMSAAWAARQVN